MLRGGSLKLLKAFDLLEINGYDLRRESGDVVFRYACKWASRGRVEAARLALRRGACSIAARITSPSRGDSCWQTLVGLRVESVLRINQHYHDSAETEITTIFSRKKGCRSPLSDQSSNPARALTEGHPTSLVVPQVRPYVHNRGRYPA